MRIFIVSIFFLISQIANAQAERQLKAYLDHKSFYAPEIGNYVEIQLQFLGYTLKYKGVEGGLQADLAVYMTIRNENNDVVVSDAYRLLSPVMRDSIVEDVYDLKRFGLNPGEYELEISLQDLNSSAPAMTGKQNIHVEDFSNLPGISDLQIAEVMTPSTKQESQFFKSGYELVPRISNYFSSQENSIPVYLELYHPENTSKKYGLKQTVLDVKSNVEFEKLTRFTKHEIESVHPLIRNLDITDLPTGEYQLVFQLLSEKDEPIAQSVFYFERLNKEFDYVSTTGIVLDPAFQASVTDDSLGFYIESLIPISTPSEVKNIIGLLKKSKLEDRRKYFQAYWVQTAGTANPYETWLKYKMQVLLVQKNYASNYQEGYETDRGRVYLQYGPPNSILARETSPSEYPYEIWIYDKIKKFSNKRFVFYNPDLVNNGYRLLHSDMVGEQQNYRWQQQLAKRNSTNQDIDNPNDGNVDHYGGESMDLFKQK